MAQDKFNKVYEGFYRTYKKREFYPRSLKGKLSDDFISAFKSEVKRLEEEEEIPVSQSVEKIAKALRFHSSN